VQLALSNEWYFLLHADGSQEFIAFGVLVGARSTGVLDRSEAAAPVVWGSC
jgi:hypothetical protein